MKKIIPDWVQYLDSIESDNSTQENKYDLEIGGLVLGGTISAEWYLSEIIKEYFIEDSLKKSEFEEYVLSKEFFNLEQKIQILQKLKLEAKKEFEEILDEEDSKKVIKNLRYIQKVRNKIAHRLREPDKENNCRKIIYLEDGKRKELFLNEKFRQEFDSVTKEVTTSLFLILSHIQMKKLNNKT
jgi:hypothetical protein